MVGEIVAACIAVGGLALVNIGVGLVGYGRLSAKVEILAKEVERLRNCINGKGVKSQ